MLKNLPGIGFAAIELEIRGEPAAKGAKTRQKLVASGLSSDLELPGAGNLNFDLVTFLQRKSLGHGGETEDRETIAPMSHPRDETSCWIYKRINGFPRKRAVKKLVDIEPCAKRRLRRLVSS